MEELTSDEKTRISGWINTMYGQSEAVLTEFNRVERISSPIKVKLRYCNCLVYCIMETVKPTVPV